MVVGFGVGRMDEALCPFPDGHRFSALRRGVSMTGCGTHIYPCQPAPDLVPSSTHHNGCGTSTSGVLGPLAQTDAPASNQEAVRGPRLAVGSRASLSGGYPGSDATAAHGRLRITLGHVSSAVLPPVQTTLPGWLSRRGTSWNTSDERRSPEIAACFSLAWARQQRHRSVAFPYPYTHPPTIQHAGVPCQRSSMTAGGGHAAPNHSR